MHQEFILNRNTFRMQARENEWRFSSMQTNQTKNIFKEQSEINLKINVNDKCQLYYT